jgi:hypothetical protein
LKRAARHVRHLAADTKTNGLRKGGRSFKRKAIAGLPVAVDNDRLAIAIVVTITVAPLDHHGLVAIAAIALTNDLAFAIAIVAGSDGYADAGRPNTHSDILRDGGHGKRNSSHPDGSHHKTLDHRLLLSVEMTEMQFALM